MRGRGGRDLIASLRERAERAESEQRLREESARQAERARIAREMHGVLAHRISLVALHAGELEMADDAVRARESAGTIRAAARQALEELREVIGVLHDGSPTPTAPQPGIDTIDRLVADSRSAGAKVTLHTAVEARDRLPDSLGLVERAELSGGTLRHGPDGAGNFVVEADLAWS